MPRVVIVSAVHDYRMARRGSIQAAADAFARAGFETSFVSVRFSWLSLLKRDPRAFLKDRANQLELRGQIECYLWRTPWHPFSTSSDSFNHLTAPLHKLYAKLPNTEMDALFRRADVIMVESGLGVVLLDRIRRLNEHALLIYRASDSLATIGAHPLLQEYLERSAGIVDHYCLLARSMAPDFWFAQAKSFYVPQGVHRADFDAVGASPYPRDGRPVAVSVGSMLFDARYFTIAASAFPGVSFHIVGCGRTLKSRDNLHVHDEMEFSTLAPYLIHADVGIAAYRSAPMSHYLAESSLKLTQFAYLRRPAVCPHFAVGEHLHRWGYTPGNAEEIISATQSALADRYAANEPTCLTWDELAPRLLRPQHFPDASIASQYFETRDGAPQRRRRPACSDGVLGPQ
jgi:2-beta-glucuronyltransferase